MHLLFVLSLLAAPEVLRVFTKPIEPFSFEQEGKAAGFSLELWQRVAEQLGLKYELTWKKTVPELGERADGPAHLGLRAAPGRARPRAPSLLAPALVVREAAQ
jgi:membrane-bound lytic murein transglycosylase MltF